MPEYKSNKEQLYCDGYFHEQFRINFYLVWCKDTARIHEWAVRNHDGSPNEVNYILPTHGGMMYLLERNGMPIPTIALPFEWENTPEQIVTLAHEVTHAIVTFFRIRHIPLPKDMHYSNNDEENLCYHIEWLMLKCLKSLGNAKDCRFKLEEESLLKTKKKN